MLSLSDNNQADVLKHLTLPHDLITSCVALCQIVFLKEIFEKVNFKQEGPRALDHSHESWHISR